MVMRVQFAVLNESHESLGTADSTVKVARSVVGIDVLPVTFQVCFTHFSERPSR